MMNGENAEFAERAELRGERQGDGIEDGMVRGVRRAASDILEFACSSTHTLG